LPFDWPKADDAAATPIAAAPPILRNSRLGSGGLQAARERIITIHVGLTPLWGYRPDAARGKRNWVLEIMRWNELQQASVAYQNILVAVLYEQ